MFKELQQLISAKGQDAWTEFYEVLEAEGLIDPEYLQHTSGRDISDAIKRVSSLSKEEVLTWLTWILRGERFCDGLFQSCIDNGSLSALLTRGADLMNDRN